MLFTSDLERTMVNALGISDTPKPADAGDDAHWGENEKEKKKRSCPVGVAEDGLRSQLLVCVCLIRSPS
jgi:hypothetical protein